MDGNPDIQTYRTIGLALGTIISRNEKLTFLFYRCHDCYCCIHKCTYVHMYVFDFIVMFSYYCFNAFNVLLFFSIPSSHSLTRSLFSITIVYRPMIAANWWSLCLYASGAPVFPVTFSIASWNWDEINNLMIHDEISLDMRSSGHFRYVLPLQMNVYPYHHQMASWHVSRWL